MKKEYISPEFNVYTLDLYDMIAASIVDVTGDSDVINGGQEGGQQQGDTRHFDIWGDDDE